MDISLGITHSTSVPKQQTVQVLAKSINFIYQAKHAYIVDFMALRTKAQETVQVQFNEVRNSGVFIAPTRADLEKSLSLLKQNGFRPMTYQEALVKIDQNPELKEQLKGNRFYLEGKGSALSGYYTFNDKGKLTQGAGDIEKTIYVYKGNQPLLLYVRDDELARYNERRFGLDAYVGPSGVAPVVVGVKIDHEAAAPKIAPELKEKFRTAVAKVEGVLDPGITDVFKEVLRTI